MTTLSPPHGQARLIERVKNILLRPHATWPIIAAEPASVRSIYSTYVVYVAAVPVLSALIGSLVFGYDFAGLTVRPSFFGAIWTAALQYALQLGAVYVFAVIIDLLSPRFGGTSDRVGALKLAAYSATASWIAGVFTLVPALSFLSIVGLYSLYLLYTGAPVLMRAPDKKALPFTAAIVGIGIVVSIIAWLLLAALAPERPVPPTRTSGKINLPGGVSLDMGKLDEATKRLGYIAKQMEAAQSGQPVGDGEQAGGDKAGAISPIAPHQLQELLPAVLPGGYQRGEVSTSSGGAGGFSFVDAEAPYTKGEANIFLSLSDIGALGAFGSIGGIFGAHSSEETETSYSRFGQVGGRMTAESYDQATSIGSYTVLVGQRVLVEAKGNRASMAELKAAVKAVDPARLESLVTTP